MAGSARHPRPGCSGIGPSPSSPSRDLRRFAHSWPTTTRHLAVLVDAGLVSVTPSGRERHYRLERQRLGDVVALWLASVGFELRASGA